MQKNFAGVARAPVFFKVWGTCSSSLLVIDSRVSSFRLMRWLLQGRTNFSNTLCKCREGFDFHQKFGLVNVKLKWVKDKELDAVVAREKDLRAVCNLVSIISSAPNSRLPVFHLSRHRGQLGLPHDLKLSTFIRRYPNIFAEFDYRDSGGTRVPCFGLTSEARDLHHEEVNVLRENRADVVERLCKLLMLTSERTLPIQTIDQLNWDMGLPYDYQDSLIPNHPDLFCLVKLSSDRVGLKLVSWDESLAVSQLQKNAALQQKKEDWENNRLAFQVKFTRGFGLKRKCMKWLEEWQTLPYTSPYVDPSHLDPRTDVSEKRNVGVFHELLHLTIGRKTERKNVSNLRKPLSLPQKFTKVFERHPGIFYVSIKCDTQTVVLREAYDRRQLLEKHPLIEIREKFAGMMAEGFLDKRRGLYKKSTEAGSEESRLEIDYRVSSEEDSDIDLISDYDSDEPIVDRS